MTKRPPPRGPELLWLPHLTWFEQHLPGFSCDRVLEAVRRRRGGETPKVVDPPGTDA